jgi:preprotein translocase subunit SecE
MSKLRETAQRVQHFGKDVELEMKRISWPTVKDASRSTVAVIVISVVLAGFLGLIDFLFSMAVKHLLS